MLYVYAVFKAVYHSAEHFTETLLDETDDLERAKSTISYDMAANRFTTATYYVIARETGKPVISVSVTTKE